MKRRDFMAGLGIAAALPAISRAQQKMPTVGFLSTRSPDEAAIHTNAFRRGLEEMSYVEGRNASIEYRWAKGVGEDPVRAGLVTSMNRPGTATGVNFFTGDLGGKRVELLCAMAPSARVIGLLVNPRFGTEVVEQHRQAVAVAAKALGRDLVVQEAATDAGIEAGFAELLKAGVAGLIVQNDPFFDSRRSQILALSSRHRLPGIFHIREYPADGGLLSYGASLSDTYRQLGVYAGKVLRGAKPDDLPVLRPTKFELVVNTRTAKTLELDVPPSIFVAADELIE
jgi:putative ABC transport system substrate-binding protein